jgi:hypothetical protein
MARTCRRRSASRRFRSSRERVRQLGIGFVVTRLYTTPSVPTCSRGCVRFSASLRWRRAARPALSSALPSFDAAPGLVRSDRLLCVGAVSAVGVVGEITQRCSASAIAHLQALVTFLLGEGAAENVSLKKFREDAIARRPSCPRKRQVASSSC